LLKISCGNADTTVVVGADAKQLCVMLPCPASDNATVKIGNRISGHRALVYGMEVLAGDDFSPIDFGKANYFDNINGKSYSINGVIPGSYALRVQATYTDGTTSHWSNRVDVHLNWPLGDVNRDGEINIADTNTVIGVILGEIDNYSTVAACDINRDGEVNINDINKLIEILFRGGE
jgi:hypothetical protein